MEARTASLIRGADACHHRRLPTGCHRRPSRRGYRPLRQAWEAVGIAIMPSILGAPGLAVLRPRKGALVQFTEGHIAVH